MNLGSQVLLDLAKSEGSIVFQEEAKMMCVDAKSASSSGQHFVAERLLRPGSSNTAQLQIGILIHSASKSFRERDIL
jgi:hypothetical protein